MPRSTAARAAAVGYRLGQLAGAGYFEPGPEPWADQPAMVHWVEGAQVLFECLETSPPERILNRLERMLDQLPLKRSPAERSPQ